MLHKHVRKLECGIRNAEGVGNFLYRVPDFKKNLDDYRAVDSSAIKDKLGELLVNNCLMAKEYHRRKK